MIHNLPLLRSFGACMPFGIAHVWLWNCKESNRGVRAHDAHVSTIQIRSQSTPSQPSYIYTVQAMLLYDAVGSMYGVGC